ncbi:RHS repeat protein [Sphingosinithalassobacter portus]|uniref:RHS repeat protein n=1 Tax=Stakelama portus TaxID=2676234 RepID=UPI000D6E8C65|nr:RHS repeat protein [Sphingosinithalassobacter portus]
MVAIFTGQGTGLQSGSASVLGGAGLLGSAAQGGSGDKVYVNASTGNLVVQRQDEFLVGLGPDVGISRSYNSLTTLSDDNGDKWRQSTDRIVYGLSGTLNTAGSTIKRVAADGSEIVYTYDTSKAAYVSKAGGGAYDRIVKSGTNWVWTDGDTGITETYDDSNGGRITQQADRSGNTLTFTYSSGKLYRVTTADGAWVQYNWSGNNITNVQTGYTDLATNTSKTLTRVWYVYASGRLSQVRTDLTPSDNSSPTDSRSSWTKYLYDSSGRVTTIQQSDGSSLSISYDSSGRVATIAQAASTGVSRTTTLSYGSNYTEVTDPSGQVTRLTYDTSGQLKQIKAPPAYSGAAQQIVSFAYNSNGDLTSSTDANGKLSSFTYDADGNLLTSTDPLNNVVTRTYGSGGLLLTETHSGINESGASVSETTRYVYDGVGRLVGTIGPRGEVTTIERDTYGQVLKTGSLSETYYNISGLASNQSVSQSALQSWISAQNKNAMQATFVSYDARGNVVSETTYSKLTSAGAAASGAELQQTAYVYDQAGQLLSRQHSGQNAETFVYDGMGRVTASTDLDGGTTTFLFNEPQQTTTITTGSGYTVTSTYNLAGDLISQVTSGANVNGGTTSYAYDSLGRVRVKTDAAGGKQFYIYDKAGRLVGEAIKLANGTGALTEYRYDDDNRLVATAQYETALSASVLTTLSNPDAAFDISSIRPTATVDDLWSWTVYDSAGRVVERINNDGTATAYKYDAAGRLVSTLAYFNTLSASNLNTYRTTAPSTPVYPTAHTNDIVTRYFYDASGNLVGALDGNGYLTRSEYDAAGRKISDTAFATATTSSLRATGSFTALVASVGTSSNDRTSHYVYDSAGVLRYTVDPLRHVVSSTYNAAGQVASATSYAATLAATTDYSFDNIQSLVSAMAGNTNNRTSWSVYNPAGHLAYAIDAGGGVAGFTYDSYGNLIKSIAFASVRSTTSLPSLATMDGWAASHASDSGNRITRSWYSARGDALYTVDAAGYVTHQDLDALGRAVATTRWNNAISVSDSTTFSQVVSLASGAGDAATQSYSYGIDGRLTLATDAEGGKTSYTYRADGQLTQRVDAFGTSSAVTTTYDYDAVGRLIEEIHAQGTSVAATTSYAYNSFGEMVSVTTNGQQTQYSYDGLGRVTLVTYNDGSTQAQAYNAFGEVWRTTDARGNFSYAWFDTLGRTVATRDAESYVTETSYTAFGEVGSVTQRYNKATGTASANSLPTVSASTSEDAVTAFSYDKLGRVLTSTDALGFVESYSYDAFGNRISVTGKSATASAAASGATVTYTYDKLGRVLTETTPITVDNGLGTVSTVVNRYEYDARGNLTKKVEADNLSYKRTTSYTYDKLNRLKSTAGDSVTVIDDGLIATTNVIPTEYVYYDARGNVVETIDAGGARTLYGYDSLNRKISELAQTSDTKGTYSSFTYDANGNLSASRVYATAVTLPSSSSHTIPSAPSGSSRSVAYVYDALNRLISTTAMSAMSGGLASGFASATRTTSYQYDAAGNVVLTTDPNGGTTYSWYDKRNHETARLDAEGYLTKWSYDPDGNVVSERRYATRWTGTVSTASAPAVSTNGADRVTTFTYDKAGNRTSETRASVASYTINSSTGALTLRSGANANSTIEYTYNGLGQVLTKTEATDETSSYTYDSAGRLTSEARSSFSDGSTTVTPTTSYRYDGLGNLTRVTQAGSGSLPSRVTSYTYAAGSGRLLSMTDASGFTRSYGYDAMGRVKKESYTRVSGSGVTEAQATRYDLAGRVIYSGVYTGNSTSMSEVDYSQTTYNSFGEVVTVSAHGQTQITNYYDSAGRLWKTNAGDGIWKVYGYDKNGNQTIVITSAGTSLNVSSFTTALGMVSQSGVNATYTTYDKRNLAITVTEEGRQHDTASLTTADTLTTSRTYNAFGEVASETNALGYTVNYTYNTMGRLTKTEYPLVTVTLENGHDNAPSRPTENVFYDISGRRIGSQDANGNIISQLLLAGTGYGSDALVATEWHPDSGYIKNSYDIFGDLRKVRNERGKYTSYAYDQMGRVETIIRPATSAGTLVEQIRYDNLGQQVLHSSSASNTTIDTTAYDALGRVVSTTIGGDTTTIEYEWHDEGASGISVSGGWTVTTTYANTRKLIEKSDSAGHMITRTDLGGHDFTFSYDVAGRLSGRTSSVGENLAYTYYNNGQVKSIATTTGDTQTDNWSSLTTTYQYDKIGQLIRQNTVDAGEEYYETYNWKFDDGVNGGLITHHVSWSNTTQNITATYDALGRLSTWSEAGGSESNPKILPASVSYKYDANGNIRRTNATYTKLNQYGQADGTTTQDYWFRYDAMNRVVTANGTLSGTAGATGTTIVRGVGGTDIAYHLDGQRSSVTRSVQRNVTAVIIGGDPFLSSASAMSSPSGPEPQMAPPGGIITIHDTIIVDQREDYLYDDAGHLTTVQMAESSFNQAAWELDPEFNDAQNYVGALPTTGTNKALYTYDLAGRMLTQTDYTSGTTVGYSRALTYNSVGRIATENTATRRGADTYLADSTYNYGTSGTTSYALGSAASVTTKNYKNSRTTSGDSAAPDTKTTNTYEWWDGAVQNKVEYDSDTGTTSNQVYVSTYSYNGSGQLKSAHINDGRPRTVTYLNAADGQVLRRDESDSSSATVGDPHELWYRFGGKQIGYVGNNGTRNEAYDASVTDRQRVQGSNTAFREGYQQNADFGLGYDAITSYAQGSSGGMYTAQGGESLAAVAANLWGDASLWYKLAEANGMSGSTTLVAGQSLILPAGVQRTHHSSTTLRPYDPTETLGDTSPTNPAPQVAQKSSKCGVFGAILLAVVAVAVTVVTSGAVLAATGAVEGGLAGGMSTVLGTSVFGGVVASEVGAGAMIGAAAIGGAVGSAVSQGVGIATGIQHKFSWSAVAMAGIGAGVSAGIGQVFPGPKPESSLTFGRIAGAAARGAAGSAITQGIGVATKLQSHFDFAGVAAAGIGAGVGYAAGKAFGVESLAQNNSAGNYAAMLGQRTVSAMANAATRSAISGGSFGDNFRAAMPDVIAQTLGDLVAFGVGGGAEKADTPAGNTNVANSEALRRLIVEGAPASLLSAGDIAAMAADLSSHMPTVTEDNDNSPSASNSSSYKEEGASNNEYGLDPLDNEVGIGVRVANGEGDLKDLDEIMFYLDNGHKYEAAELIIGLTGRDPDVSNEEWGSWAERLFRQSPFDDYSDRSYDNFQKIRRVAYFMQENMNDKEFEYFAWDDYSVIISVLEEPKYTMYALNDRPLKGAGLVGDMIIDGIATFGVGAAAKAGVSLVGKPLAKLGTTLLKRSVAAERGGADLIASRPKILSDASLPPDELAYLQKQFSRKELSIQRAANRGELTFSPGTDSVRIKSLQEAYRADVAARYESMYGKLLDLGRFNADHPVDLIIGGAAHQRLRLLNDTINQSVGSSLRQAAKRANLAPGAPINSVIFR